MSTLINKLQSLPPTHKALLTLGLTLPIPSLGVLAGFILWPDTTLGQTIYAFGKLWLLGWPLSWLWFVDKYRPQWHWPTKEMTLVGIGLGLAINAVILGGYWLLGPYLLDTTAIATMAAEAGLNNLTRYIAAFLFWVTINSAIEEIIWRWFVVRQAELLTNAAGAVLIAALGFTAHHVLAMRLFFDWPMTILASLGLIIGASLWSATYIHYRSLWPAYISHALVDIAVFGLGYIFIFT
ncbi:MAG TPA: CPBP family intramembrane glutamic endopeptidase [Anaerolineae bacterium]|nr:CPBP family intramembrane glutamic endopeptidase [Anaerolineae bacterium]